MEQVRDYELQAFFTCVIEVPERLDYFQRLQWYNEQAAREGWVCP